MAEETKETKKIIPESKKKKKRKKKKVLLKVSVVFLLLVVIGWFTFGAKVMKLRSEAKELVAQSSEDTFKASQTSIVYDTNGKQLLKFKGEKDVYYLKYKELPVYVIAAVISVEDRNFYKHSGVDYKGISRAAVSYVVHKGAITQGGSTLTQQLAKTVFLNRQKTWKRKVKEIFMAVELEKKYSKEQILEFYLNNVYYSNGYYGIQAASQGYFRKDAKNLTMSEAAFLSAIPNNPTIYDPRTNKENTIKRRNKILKDMYEQNLIKKDQYEEALNEDIDVKKAQKTKTEKKNYIETYVIHCATKEIMKQKGFEFKDDFSSNSEKKKYQEEKRIKDLDDREAAITRRELTAQAKVQLADKGIPTELAEILILTDADSCKKSIETVEKAFQTAVQRAVEERIKGREPMKKAKDAKLTDEELVYQKMMGK